MMKPSLVLQRFEGVAIAIGAMYLYHRWGGSWLLFLPIWLAIDLSMIGYLAGPRVGAYVYNAGHTLIMPIVLLAIGSATDSAPLQLLSMIWFAHVGIDRALGYGLKYTDNFQHTHLGMIGKHRQ